jgi:hypothetical protein
VAGYAYNVSFRITHPSIDPRELTRRFAMKPRWSWKSGELLTFPSGRVLKTPKKDSYWCYSEHYEGRSKNFFRRVGRLANRLKLHKIFLQKITESGGRCEIYVQLPGAKNIGDSLSPKALQLLADLDILLSVEVFPDMRTKKPG